jgi:hypothetical protein
MGSPKAVTATVMILTLGCGMPLLAQGIAKSASGGLRSNAPDGYVYNVWYDGRDDVRDFPNNGFFPGDFAADPAGAAIGAAGIFGSTPVSNYHPPQAVIVGSQPDQARCAHHYRSYDRASGTFLGHDGVRHRCP